MEKTCCFTGHRDISKKDIEVLVHKLDKMIQVLYDRGIRTFLCGGALGFDTLAAQMVLCHKKLGKDIKLVLVLPCADQSARWQDEDKERYESIKELSDEVICLSKKYYKGCMHDRNRYMVDNSGVCIAYLTKQSGGSYYTVCYAKEKNKPVVNLA